MLRIMKRAISLILLLVALSCAGLDAAAKNKGPFIGMHPEGSEEEGPRMVRPDTVGGQKRWFRMSPEVSGRHFGGYTPFAAADGNGMGALLYLNEEGMRAAMVMCSTFNGKLARILVNGRTLRTALFLTSTTAPASKLLISTSNFAQSVTQAYLTLSEVLGHMDLLLEDDSVAEVLDDAGVVHFEAR